MKIYRTKDLPENANLSDDLKGRAKYFCEVYFFGLQYFIPLTKEMKKIFQVSIKKGCLEPYGQANRVEEAFRDIIASVYLQVRDTVGSAIYQNLKQDIQEGFEKMFSNGLERAINGEFDKQNKQLEDRSTP